jgi:hypothetical protein
MVILRSHLKRKSGRIACLIHSGSLRCSDRVIKVKLTCLYLVERTNPVGIAFVDMLNEMRFGKLSQASIARFKKLSRPLKFDDGIDATEL